MVKKSRLYIPGRVLWGAMTNTLTELLAGAHPVRGDFVKIGEQLGPCEQTFGSFFPSFDEGKTRWFPCHTGNGIYWYPEDSNGSRPLPDSAMAQRLIGSTAGAAIHPERLSAIDAQLHATDHINPYWRDHANGAAAGAVGRVHFAGAMQLPNHISLNVSENKLDEKMLDQVFRNCRIGGGRRPGLGRVELASASSASSATKLTDRFPAPGQEGYEVILNPVPVVSDQGWVRGNCHLAVYREFCPGRGSGQAFSQPTLVWEVGSVLESKPPKNG